MREIICTVKRSRGSKRRPKVMTAIGRTHPTSGSTRHTTAFSLKERGTSAQYSYSINMSPI